LSEYQEKVAPVKVGESYDVSIDDIAKEGDGIARVEVSSSLCRKQSRRIKLR